MMRVLALWCLGSVRRVRSLSTAALGKVGSRHGYLVHEEWPVPHWEGAGVAEASAVFALPAALQLLAPDVFPSASRARKACRRGEILVNGKVGRCISSVRAGDVVAQQLRYLPAYYPKSDSERAPFPLEVVYEDEHIGIVLKPSGPSTYSAKGQGGGRFNVRSALPFALSPPPVATEGCLRRPQPCHRLDAATSGLLVAAKTKPALVAMCALFAERRVGKTYVAIVFGGHTTDQDRGLIDSPLDVKVPGKGGSCKVKREAVTEWEQLSTSASLVARSLKRLRLRPRTGRTHQLRRHCAEVLGSPIVGDVLYDGGTHEALKLRGSGLFLCATELRFDHPITHAPLVFQIDEPPKFAALLDREQTRARIFADQGAAGPRGEEL